MLPSTRSLTWCAKWPTRRVCSRFRGTARALEEDVAFRVLAASNFPQHRTLCAFRRRHLDDFQALFVEVVRLAQELGLASLGKLSVDGHTKEHRT